MKITTNNHTLMAGIGNPANIPSPTPVDKGETAGSGTRPDAGDFAVDPAEIDSFISDASEEQEVAEKPVKKGAKKAVVEEAEENDEEEEEDDDEEEEDDEDDEEDDEEDGEEEDEDEDEDEDKDAIIKALRKKLAKREKPVADLKASEINEIATPEDIDPNEELGLTDEEVDAAMDDPKKLKTLLGKVFAKGRETIMRAIPELVAATQQRQSTVQTAITQFYEENSQLNEHKEFVGYITNKVHKEHPDWTLTKIFDEVAKRSYEGLKIRKSARKAEQDRKKTPAAGGGNETNARRPAFAKGGRGKSRSNPSDTRSDILKEIDDLISM